MSVGYMGIIRGCFSFPYVDGGRISGWQEQAGKAGGVLAPLLADTVSVFCRALIKMRMATHTEQRFWGENISSHGCQWYKRGKRIIRRSLSIFQKWKLTVLKQKREWDLSISSGNHSCQKERCQMGLPNLILLEPSVVSGEGEESKRFNGGSMCTTSLRIKLRPCTLFHLKMYYRVYLCRTGEVKLPFWKEQTMDGSYPFFVSYSSLQSMWCFKY